MRERLMLGLVLVGMLGGSVALAAEGNATKRTTAGADRVGEVKKLLGMLANSDTAKRDEARRALMGLKRTELPLLREAVEKSLPLEPSQAVVLKDVVIQIYLAGDTYASEEGGFLGVKLASWGRPEERTLLSLERGVAVVSRISGFCAFRMLQDGDVVLSIGSGAGGSGTGQVAVNSPDELIAVVGRAKAGDTLLFEVQRQGQIVKVEIVLDRRPIGLTAGAIEEFTGQRMDRANEVWERDFAPLLGVKVG